MVQNDELRQRLQAIKSFHESLGMKEDAPLGIFQRSLLIHISNIENELVNIQDVMAWYEEKIIAAADLKQATPEALSSLGLESPSEEVQDTEET